MSYDDTRVVVAELDGIQSIFSLLQSRYGLDFDSYKSSTITRRIERRVRLSPYEDPNDYVARLQRDHDELEAVYRDLLIGFTEFFRDSEAFALLEREVIPKLVARADDETELRLWVAGCATGEEAYSLGILLIEAFERAEQPVRAKIFATDIHRPSLDYAGAGIYPTTSVAPLGEARISRFFSAQDGAYRVSSELRRMVVFTPHDALRDPPFTNIDLVSCRNLLVYLRPPAQRQALSSFDSGLNPHGVLFLGPIETPGDLVEEFEPIDLRWRIYRKRRDTVVQRLAAGKTSRPSSRETHLRDLFGLLLDEILPPSVLVDREFQIVHTFGDVRAHLSLPRGRPSLSLLDLLDGDLALAVAGALHRAAQVGAPIRAGDNRKYDVRVRPLELSSINAVFYLVSLTPSAAQAAAPQPELSLELEQASRVHLEAIETELRQTKENLQATIEELEVSNEELLARNEELRSVNEELYTVNLEFQQKIDELTELTDDMHNLLLCTEVHTLFLDEDLAIRKFTPAMAEVFNLVATDIGRRIDGFVYSLDMPDLVDQLARVRASGERYERAVHHRGLTYLMRVLPYRSRGRRAGVVLTLVDVNRLEQVELALREQVEHRDRFLATLSHELRNPLAAVSNALRLIDRRLDTPGANIVDPLDMIVRQTAHMQRLLDDLLDVARLTQGKLALRKAPLDISALLSEVIEQNRAALADHQLALEAPSTQPIWVFGDATRLVQIFDNLLINAIKYTPAGGHITVELASEGNRAVVRVRDDGAGIEAHAQAHIFEPFVQADFTLARSQGGLGVGLTLVKNLVALHDGDIEVHSDGLGEGSEFVVRFPCVQAPAQPTIHEERPARRHAEAPVPRVMVVEDRPEIRETLAELLVDYGFAVSTAPDGLRGYEKMVAEPPDAALLDIGLPGLDGYELARKLREHASTSSLPLIAITGYGRAEDAMKARAAGFDTHLVKPVNMDDVLGELARLGIRPASGPA